MPMLPKLPSVAVVVTSVPGATNTPDLPLLGSTA